MGTYSIPENVSLLSSIRVEKITKLENLRIDLAPQPKCLNLQILMELAEIQNANEKDLLLLGSYNRLSLYKVKLVGC